MRYFTRLLVTVLFALGVMSPAYALDRVQWYFSENPPSSWMNQYERDVRLGSGQFWWNALGGNSFFSNLCVVPNSGLNINVGPCGVNSLASLYQYLPEETNTFGGPTGALPTDSTQVDLEGLMASAQSIGPLNGPGTGGWSIIYTVECKVATVDTSSMSENFVSVLGAVTSQNVNRDRQDQISCQSKAGVAAASPSPPVVDAGYLGVANVQVPQGTSTITGGMITALTANGFYGFLPLQSDGQSVAIQGTLITQGNITTNGNLAFNNTASAIITSNTTGVHDAFDVNALAGTPPTGNLIDFQVQGSAKAYISMAGQIFGTNANTFAVTPVCVNSGPASCNNNTHIMTGTCGFAASTSCAVSSLNPAWTASTSYTCWVDEQTATGYVGYTIGNHSTSGFTIYASASNSNSVGWVCEGY